MNDTAKPKRASWDEYDAAHLRRLSEMKPKARAAKAVKALLRGLEVGHKGVTLPKTYFPQPNSEAERLGRIELARQLRAGTVTKENMKHLANLIDPELSPQQVPRSIRFEFRTQGVGQGGLVDTFASGATTARIVDAFRRVKGLKKGKAAEVVAEHFSVEPTQVARIVRRSRKKKVT